MGIASLDAPLLDVDDDPVLRLLVRADEALWRMARSKAPIWASSAASSSIIPAAGAAGSSDPDDGEAAKTARLRTASASMTPDGCFRRSSSR